MVDVVQTKALAKLEAENKTQECKIFYNFINSFKLKSWAQRLINLEIPVLIRSLKSSNVELGEYLDVRLFKCRLSAAANP